MDEIKKWEEAAALYARIAPPVDAQLSARHGITLSDFFAMRALAHHPKGHMRIQALAEEIGLSPSAMSRLVSRLETGGSFRRFVCDTDKRGMYTELTDVGRDELRKIEATYEAAVKAALAD